MKNIFLKRKQNTKKEKTIDKNNVNYETSNIDQDYDEKIIMNLF